MKKSKIVLLILLMTSTLSIFCNEPPAAIPIENIKQANEMFIELDYCLESRVVYIEQVRLLELKVEAHSLMTQSMSKSLADALLLVDLEQRNSAALSRELAQTRQRLVIVQVREKIIAGALLIAFGWALAN